MALEWRKICCPVDFSESARAAFVLASDLSCRLGCELALIHVQVLPGLVFPTGEVFVNDAMLARAEVKGLELLGQWRLEAEQMGVTRVTTATAIGTPFMEIVEFARLGGYDLIVMGTHGRTALAKVLLGSVADNVVRRASCPVLTVRATRLKEEG